jgi:hypothetical protein
MSKRKPRRAPAARQAQTQETRPPQTRAASARAATPTATPNKAVNFQEEYHYILTDLKRFGILAVAMFATLIVLALALG